jgi:protein phosphatase 1G
MGIMFIFRLTESVRTGGRTRRLQSIMGAYLSSPITAKYSDDGYRTVSAPETFLSLAFGVSEMHGWRRNMEDAHVTLLSLQEVTGHEDGSSLFGVFDGHGGKEVAHFCKRHIAEELCKTNHYESGQFDAALRNSFHKMDSMLCVPEHAAELMHYQQMDDGSGSSEETEASIRDSMQAKGSISKQEGLLAMLKIMEVRKRAAASEARAPDEGSLQLNAGCTAVVALFQHDTLFVANAGDSRCVACRVGGAAEALSLDHKPNDEVELTRIEQAGGHVNEVGRVNGNLNLSRSIGDLKYKQNPSLAPQHQIITAEPDVTTTPLLDNNGACQLEFIVLACDGVWDVKSSQEVVDFVRERLQRGAVYGPVSRICEELLDDCLSPDPQQTQGIGCDNMTCMVVCLPPALAMREEAVAVVADGAVRGQKQF